MSGPGFGDFRRNMQDPSGGYIGQNPFSNAPQSRPQNEAYGMGPYNDLATDLSYGLTGPYSYGTPPQQDMSTQPVGKPIPYRGQPPPGGGMDVQPYQPRVFNTPPMPPTGGKGGGYPMMGSQSPYFFNYQPVGPGRMAMGSQMSRFGGYSPFGRYGMMY